MARTQRIRQVQATDVAGVRSGAWNLRILEHRGGAGGEEGSNRGRRGRRGRRRRGAPRSDRRGHGASLFRGVLRCLLDCGRVLDRGSGLPCGIVDAREVRSWLAEWLGGWQMTPSVHDAGTKVTRGSRSGSKLTPGHEVLGLVAHANIEAKVISPSFGWGAAPCNCSRPEQGELCSDRASKRAKACQSGLRAEYEC